MRGAARTWRSVTASHITWEHGSVIVHVREWRFVHAPGRSCTHACMTAWRVQVLLPRFGVEPDPDYDPEEDWEADSKVREPRRTGRRTARYRKPGRVLALAGLLCNMQSMARFGHRLPVPSAQCAARRRPWPLLLPLSLSLPLSPAQAQL